jgi:hypothetical protein
MNAHACSLKEQQSVKKPDAALREVQQQQAAVVLDESQTRALKPIAHTGIHRSNFSTVKQKYR